MVMSTFTPDWYDPDAPCEWLNDLMKEIVKDMKKPSDKKYLEWLSYQPSCLSGEFSQYIDGVGRNIAAHVRRAKNSGTGYKPKYNAVPLTDKEHQYQHIFGERALLEKYNDCHWPVKAAKEWFDDMAESYLEKWKCTVTKPA